jgi:hypothetical protein
MNLEKICIGIPHTGLFHWQTISAILGLQIPKGYAVSYHLIGSCLVYDAREKIVEFAKNNDCKYILYLDSDMVPPNDMLFKMLEHLKNPDIDIISGMAFKRTPPFQPCFYTKLQYDSKKFEPYLESPVEFPDVGLLPIQGAGMACCMIKTELFNKIKKPYFFPLPNLGEDLTFCYKARIEANAKMFCDLSIDTGHIAQMPISKDHFKACFEEYKKTKNPSQIFIDAEKA